ncbi:hypothetical protein QQM39_04055 [Streptomyces sp. DT2A-34]|uniref:hypothetical protein n=1 Tax=Streptomyces sp. DT2A-34 TaxID=3051182 RepID=UPI00265C4D29|nr:hypothetical protein [Streptomyces sp. DT2A-34]MDO0910062.1 hypothetical protein [Streptomyces sp. DT2A-34]
MRTIPMTTAPACLFIAAALAGCGVGAGSGGAEKSAAELLDEANGTMRALRSVTIDMSNTPGDNRSGSVRRTTSARTRPVSRTGAAGRSSASGRSSGRRCPPTTRSRATDWPRAPGRSSRFGTAKKGAATRVGGREVIAVHVTDKADKEGAYTFYVATEGKPYLLRTVYKGGGNVTTTSFSAFDEALDVRPSASEQVLDKADVAG